MYQWLIDEVRKKKSDFERNRLLNTHLGFAHFNSLFHSSAAAMLGFLVAIALTLLAAEPIDLQFFPYQ